MKNAKKILLVGISVLLVLTPSWFATASATKSSTDTTQPKYSNEYYNQRANDFNQSIDSMKCVKEDSLAEAKSRRSTGKFAYTGNTYVLSLNDYIIDTTAHAELGLNALLETVQVPANFYQLNTEIACMARTLNAEQGQSIPDCFYVGQVIMNRLHDTQFYGKRNYKNVFDVLFDYKQFSANPYYVAPGQQKTPGRNWRLDNDERSKVLYKIAVLCFLNKIPERLKIDERTLAFFMPHQCSASFVNTFHSNQVTHKSPNGTVYCRLSRD